jgi:hypothetical protein
MTREFTVEPIPRGERRVGLYSTAIPNVMLSIVLQVQDGHRNLELNLVELPAERMVASYGTWIEIEIERASIHHHAEGPYMAVGNCYFSLTLQLAEHLVRDFGFPYIFSEENEEDGDSSSS